MRLTSYNFWGSPKCPFQESSHHAVRKPKMGHGEWEARAFSRRFSFSQTAPAEATCNRDGSSHQAVIHLQDCVQMKDDGCFKRLSLVVVCYAAIDNWDVVFPCKPWTGTANWQSPGPCPGCKGAGRMDISTSVEGRGWGDTPTASSHSEVFSK